jgi:hypothetical protein
MISLLKDWPCLSITLLTTTIGYIAFFTVASMGWPGETSHEHCFEDNNHLTVNGCFCERPRPNSLIAQPANTWSNLIYNVVAIFLAWSADSEKFPNPRWWHNNVNLFTREKYFMRTFCPVLSNVGYCSSSLHASFTLWSDKLDLLAIMALFIWLELFSLCKFVLMFKGWSNQGMRYASIFHGITWTIIMIPLVTLDYMGKIPDTRALLNSVGVFLLIELLIRYFYEHCKNKERMSQSWLGFVGVLFFAAGFALLRMSTSVCYPESWFQPHALWHVLSGIAMTSLFFFLLSDRFVMQRRHGRKIRASEVRMSLLFSKLNLMDPHQFDDELSQSDEESNSEKGGESIESVDNFEDNPRET